MFDLAQCAAGVLEDYIRMTNDATKTTVSPMVLATALELCRVHGVRLSAAYLQEAGVALDVALELLARSLPL